MGAYFLDTSAIVKRYVPEKGQTLISTLCEPEHGHDLYISQAALVEVVASICRKAHEKSITITERDALIDTFRQDTQNTYSIRLVTTAMYTFAGNLCRSHRLRAYDAVQLACMLDLRNDSSMKKAPPPVFVCADNNLVNIAIAEGLSTVNPNDYP